MIKIFISFIVLLVGLISPVSLWAQDRWHIVRPDHIDTSFYAITSLSCHSGNCSAAAVTWGPHSGNSVFFLISTDNGTTWKVIDTLPQWIYNSNGKVHTYFDKIQQIDSTNAIAVDQYGYILRTIDGWKTILKDTSHAGSRFHDVDFSDPAEGIIDEGFGRHISTIDTGKHWTQITRQNGDWAHAYGADMFRIFSISTSRTTQDTLYTTHNNWQTIDTFSFVLNGPFLDTDVTPSGMIFGGEDTLAIVGYRWNPAHTQPALMMALSPDLGTNWTEVPLPPNIRMENPTISPITAQTIVIAGQDSVGCILISSDHGTTWKIDTIALDNGKPYYWVKSVGITGSGRIIASIVDDSNTAGSNSLAYLEHVSADVRPNDSEKQNIPFYPDPAMNTIVLESPLQNVSILDPLGRIYSVPRNGNTLDVSSLPGGVYFLSDGVNRAKFVKE